jgi:hypothetical protein
VAYDQDVLTFDTVSGASVVMSTTMIS